MKFSEQKRDEGAPSLWGDQGWVLRLRPSSLHVFTARMHLRDWFNTYTWSARNELMSISGGVAANFQYDAFGRRVSKTMGGTTQYLYDGVDPIEELSGTTVTATTLAGLGVDEYLQRTDANGPASFLTDALGSTVALTGSTGASLASYTYEPFGNTTITRTSTNSFQFTGRENDSTGLYFYRARYYSATFQRFIAEDPIRFLGGDANLYTYAYRDPLDLRDASGRCPLCVAGIVVGIGGLVGSAEEGYKAYKCGARGWNLAGAAGRGFAAGAVGTAAGLAAGFYSGNPFLGGAAGAATYNLVNQQLGANVSTSQAIVSTLAGGAVGVAGDALSGAIDPVQGGSNFNPFTSPRTFGPKAGQLYLNTGISGGLGAGADLGVDAGLAKLNGRKNACE